MVSAPTIGLGYLDVRPNPPAGEVGVSINDGAIYTNDPKVQLSLVWPSLSLDVLLSNDGGFRKSVKTPLLATLPWTLDSSGSERLPKTVYLRFLFGTFASPNYTDDIILDERPPVVSQASVAPAAAAAAARAAALKKWNVKVKASDSNSGVAGLQVTTNKRKPGKLLKYKRKLTVKSRMSNDVSVVPRITTEHGR